MTISTTHQEQERTHDPRIQGKHNAPRTPLTVSRTVGGEALPEEIRAYSGLDRIDFADQVCARGVPRRSAEQWARATVGIVHPAAGTLIWHVGLRGRLDHRRSPDLIGGWRVTHRDEHHIRLEIPSTVMSLRLMLTTEDDRVTLTTCVRFDTPRGKVAWKTIEPLHGFGDPRLLGGAARRERDRDRNHWPRCGRSNPATSILATSRCSPTTGMSRPAAWPPWIVSA